jgi:hypothetical protein
VHFALLLLLSVVFHKISSTRLHNTRVFVARDYGIEAKIVRYVVLAQIIADLEKRVLMLRRQVSQLEAVLREHNIALPASSSTAYASTADVSTSRLQLVSQGVFLLVPSFR